MHVKDSWLSNTTEMKPSSNKASFNKAISTLWTHCCGRRGQGRSEGRGRVESGASEMVPGCFSRTFLRGSGSRAFSGLFLRPRKNDFGIKMAL